jgi:hypothetical protein
MLDTTDMEEAMVEVALEEVVVVVLVEDMEVGVVGIPTPTQSTHMESTISTPGTRSTLPNGEMDTMSEDNTVSGNQTVPGEL